MSVRRSLAGDSSSKETRALYLAKRASWEPGVGFTRRTMSRTGAASGSVSNGV